jgi:DNA-binding protein H-NS
MSKYAEIRARISDLQKQADDMYVSEKKAAIADIKEKIRIYDITAAEIGLVKKTRANAAAKPAAKAGRAAKVTMKAAKAPKTPKAKVAAKKPAPPKYQGPNGETWAGGRGKRPMWVNEILAAGGDMEDYKIA